MATPMPPPADRDAMVPQPARVLGVHRETADVMTLELDPNGLPDARPGQFNMLYAFGIGEAAISVTDGGAGGRGPVHTVRAVGAVTRALTSLEPGEPLGVRGPFGSAWPLDQCDGRDVVVIAGGLGLAPLYGAIAAILKHRQRYGRLAVLAGGRSPDVLIRREMLETWRRDPAVQVEITVDHAGPDWPHDVGVVTDLLGRVGMTPDRTTALLCGPEVMMRFAAAALEDRGVASDAIFVSLERNMKCALGHCGHCQLGSAFVCKDGPVLAWNRVAHLLRTPEV